MKRIICVCMAFLLLLTGCQSSQDTVEEETTNNTASMDHLMILIIISLNLKIVN